MFFYVYKMKLLMRFALLFLLCVQGIQSFSQVSRQLFLKTGNQLRNWLEQEDFQSISDALPKELLTAYSANLLEQEWGRWIDQKGTAIEYYPPILDFNYYSTQIRIPIACEKGFVQVISLLDSNARLRSFQVQSIATPQVQSIATPYKVPEYVKEESFSEKRVTFGYDNWMLKGVLSMPLSKGPHPLVIIVCDTDPKNKDGSIGGYMVHRDLAHALSSNGFAVLRYDSRSLLHGTGIFSLTNNKNPYTPKEEVIDDVTKAIQTFRTYPGIDSARVFALGIGYGGMLLPRIVEECKQQLRGIVLMAAYSRSMQQVVIDQMNYLYPDTAKLDHKTLLKKSLLIRTARNALQPNIPIDYPVDSLLNSVGPHFWNYLNRYNPVLTLQKLQTPSLVLYPERDYQCTSADFKNWQNLASKKATIQCKSYPALNHYFVAGSGKSKPTEYQQQGNVSEEVITDILHWLRKLD